MYGSAMVTSPEKKLVHNIPTIRYHRSHTVIIRCGAGMHQTLIKGYHTNEI